MNERERRGPESPAPEFVETIGIRKRVGILADGTWMVGWQRPPASTETEGRTAWHHHSDVWAVLRQNTRVIDKFLGVPISKSEVDEGIEDPNLGASLPDLLLIAGENEQARALAQQAERIIAYSNHGAVTSEGMKRALADIAGRIENVRNPHKVEARNRIASAMSAGDKPNMQEETLAASDALLRRAQEGASITRSLFDRGTALLEWVKLQEIPLLRLKFVLGQALTDISNGKINPQRWEDFTRGLSGDHSFLDDIKNIRGRPYSELAERRELVRLRGAREMLVSGSTERVRGIFEQAYILLLQVSDEKGAREKSGKFDMYTKK